MTTQELLRQIRISTTQYDRTHDIEHLNDVERLIAYKKATARDSNPHKEIIPHA